MRNIYTSFDEINSKCSDVAKLLIEGLTTDGAHHKQYYMEKALMVLYDDKFFNEAKNEFIWEDGIP